MVLHKIGVMAKDNVYAYNEALEQYINCYKTNCDQKNKDNLSSFIDSVCTSCITIKVSGVSSPDLKDVEYYKHISKLHRKVAKK